MNKCFQISKSKITSKIVTKPAGFNNKLTVNNVPFKSQLQQRDHKLAKRPVHASLADKRRRNNTGSCVKKTKTDLF